MLVHNSEESERKRQCLTHAVVGIANNLPISQLQLNFMICICHTGSSLGYKLRAVVFLIYIDLQF